MSILSDRQIKYRCMKPTHFLSNGDKWEPIIPGVTHTQSAIDYWVRQGRPGLRAITKESDYELYDWKPMIEPFVPEAVRFKEVDGRQQKIISYGLSSYGYDIRISGEDIKLFTNLNATVVDPMRPQTENFTAPHIFHDEEFGLDYFILPPNSLALAHTVEYFNIPRDVLVTCLGKSTYARVGLSQIVTPLEPEWSGDLVLEIASMTNCPTRVYIGCGIAQLVFMLGSEVCEVSYKDRGGKYQGQRGTTLARI